MKPDWLHSCWKSDRPYIHQDLSRRSQRCTRNIDSTSADCLLTVPRSGWDKILGAARNPNYIRKTRKHLYQEIGSNKNVSRFEDVQATEVARFLLRVLEEPDKLQQHIRK